MNTVVSSLLANPSPLKCYSLTPTRIVWRSDTGVTHVTQLLGKKPGQSLLQATQPPTMLTSTPSATAGVLLDFGVELQGYLELFTPQHAKGAKLRRVRIRFGESVSEAMAQPGGKTNATNDHALRDQVVELPWLGKKIVGPSGFRFVRIDAADPDVPVELTEVRAVLQIRDIPYIGSFTCSDPRLDRIWQVGAYTVHLNMQEYLWDGIKRDRLVWLGDMHPEVSTINAVFGSNEVVPQSLDLIRSATPADRWMNGISSYSMWWIIIHEEWFLHHGGHDYLRAQKDYLTQLLSHLVTFIDEGGSEKLNGMRFLDWPTYRDLKAVHEGLQAMMILAMESGSRLMTTLGDPDRAGLCRQAVEKLRRHQPQASGRKSPAALLALAGGREAMEVAGSTLLRDGSPGAGDISTFYGYYVLSALARAGQHTAALELIRAYWGAMIDLGATTFWEDFDLKWAQNAGPIDQLVPPGQNDIHGNFGAHCYMGFRHSLCHGWASGPTAWLSRHVLGIEPIEPGFARARVAPNLGDLQWAQGTYPTPHGPITVRHERQSDASVRSTLDAPRGVELIRAT